MNYYTNRRGNFLTAIPPVTRFLLIANVVLFILTFLAGSSLRMDLREVLSLYNFQSENFSSYQVISHMFMHADFGHLFFNMFGLFMFGRTLETVLGGKKFFILYFVSGLGAALLQQGANYVQIQGITEMVAQFKSMPSPEFYWEIASKYNFNDVREVIAAGQNYGDFPQDQTAANNAYVMCERMVFTMKNAHKMLGASGAIFGILAAFALLFPNVELMLIFLPIPIKAKYFMPIYAVIELFFGVANFSFSNIAHFAHLGGAIFGFALVWYWKKNRFRQF